MFFSPNILSEATIEKCSTKQVFFTCGQKTWKIHLKDVFIQMLVLSIFETNQTITKKPQEEVINWYLLFATLIHHRSVMWMSHVMQSCKIKATGCEAESTPKIEFSSCRITFPWQRINKESSFSYGKLNVILAIQFFLSTHQTSINGFKIPATKSSFIHSSFRSAKSVFVQWFCIYIWLCIEIFYCGSDNFCFSNLKLSCS